jgi:hypothetical protein
MNSNGINKGGFTRSLLFNDNAFLFYIAFLKLLILFVSHAMGLFGYFRDEFYYLACSDHLAWGYVDQPPFSIAILWLSRILFGDSLLALRIFPALAGSAVIILTGLMVRELGGARYAQMLAACLVLFAPLTLGIDSVFSMNSFDALFWTLAFYYIILILKNDLPKYWIILGCVFGLGLLNKISVLWLGAGFAFGLLLTSNRTLFLKRNVWITAAIALLMFLPHIIWQIAYGFPTLEFIKNATGNKYISVSPLDLLLQQTLVMNPATLLIWLSGVLYFLISKPAKQFRILPIIYLVVLLILIVNKNSKSEYLGPMFPMLFAAGAFTLERFIYTFNWRWLKPVAYLFFMPIGIVLAPIVIPLLPVETYIAYSQSLGIKPSTPEKKELSKLPQFYADRFGWEEMTAAVAHAYSMLTPEQKEKCVIMCNNYGEAGAIDFFGKKYNLPKAISGHNNYWLWGCRDASGEVVIRLGGSIERMRDLYTDVTQAGVFQNAYCMPYENNKAIWICKHRRIPLKDDWLEFRHYD